MLVNFIGFAVVFFILALILILSGVRNGHPISASMGGLFMGISTATFAVQLFYFSQFHEMNPGIVYRGTSTTEAILVAGLAVSLVLVALSVLGVVRKKPFWRSLA